jgi:hypothetical protein
MDGDIPDVECWECGHSVHCGCDNDCDHEDAIEEAFFDLHMDYHYTMAINDFIANNNAAWLRAIRDDSRLRGMKVECTIDIETQQPTIHIRFQKGTAPAGFTKTSMYKGALRYMRDMGILSLDIRGKLDFVIGEHTGKYTRHFEGCSYPIPTYNQVHVVSPIGAKSAPSTSGTAPVTATATATAPAAPAASATALAASTTAPAAFATATSSTATVGPAPAPTSTTAPTPAASVATVPAAPPSVSPTAPVIASMD